MGIPSITTNLPAQNVASNLRKTIDDIQIVSAQVSSGNRIVTAKIDAAGLSVGMGLRTDQSTLTSALSTTAQAQSILAIADGGMDNVGQILARLKSLASQANSAANSSTELGYIKTEMDQLVTQLTSIVNTTTFNGQKIIDGTYSSKAFQVGTLSSDTISVSVGDATVSGLGLSSIDVTTDIAGANTALDNAISSVKGYRATVGALQSSFTFAANNISTSVQNLDAARANYLDADLAQGTTAFSNLSVAIQASVGILAKVNDLPQGFLQLIR